MRSNEAGIKVFGAEIPGVTYLPRPAAYAIIRGAKGEVAAVKTERGHFLPGGGSEFGETPEETVRREVREELAREVRIKGEPASVVQYLYADWQYYRMEATFYEADFEGGATGAGEYEICWVEPDELKGSFFHESHEWAAKNL